MKFSRPTLAVVCFLTAGCLATAARGQGYGTDLQNIMGPASGGMAGVSVARPQDVPSACFGNPATLAQFQGTQFTMGGGWIEGYPTIRNDGTLNFMSPGTPFSVTSRAQGALTTEIGATQDLRSMGLPATMGMGLAGVSGGAAEYRGEVPQNTTLNNLSSDMLVLGVNLGLGMQVTDSLAAGASLNVGTAMEQLGFVGPISSSAMVTSYALSGSVGLDYDLNESNTVGGYYQLPTDFTFPNAVRVGGNYRDLEVAQPGTVGLGIANRSFLDGNLLLAADMYYKMWQDAPLYKDVFINQWAFAFGAQLTHGRIKYRAGYSYNTNPLNHSVGSQLEGVPIAQSELQLFQAASMATIDQNRISGGIGYQGFLIPNLDLDLFAGGLFSTNDTFGSTSAEVAVYYVGMGLTWRFGDGAPRPDAGSAMQSAAAQ